jgi:hypothetical protein
MTTEMQPGSGGLSGIQALRMGMRGEVLERNDAGYDAARQVYNANIDRYPGIIARCRDVADVISAVGAARAGGKAAAIRGGGHNVAGLGTCDDDLLVDLSGMRGVRVDPMSGRVRVEGGCTIGKLDHAANGFGLGVPAGIISTTGVAGLTLGGGFGHLSRQYGLSCDSLISADVVTADGEVVVADEQNHAELFWAIRGGGGNFGVVTSFEFQAHPVAAAITGGPMFWPKEQAGELFERYDAFIEQAPEEMSAFINYHVVPPADPFPSQFHMETMCGVVFCYNGPQSEARELMEPLLSGFAPAIDLVGPLPYPQLQQMFDAIIPRGLHHYWKTLYLDEMSEEVIDVHLKYGPRLANTFTTVHVYPLNGAVQRVGADDTAFRYRDVKYAANIVGVAPTAEDFMPIRAWVREYFDALKPYSAGAGYVNFMMTEGGEQAVREVFGDNYERLVAVKNQYDPSNLFRINHNIRPTVARA